ncbi:glutaredoxin family protein [Thiobacillus sp.]
MAVDYVYREFGMKAGFIMAAVWLSVASAPLAAAQLYQWKDAQGRMVYSDQAPPPSIKNAQQKSFKGSFIEGGESYATLTAREKFPITLYASACGTPCDQARQLLTERGVPFNSKDPQASPEAQEELKKLTGQLRVPVLFVGKEKIDGFESTLWHAALDRAGYPKSALPGRKPAPANAAPPAPAPAAAP